MKKSTKKTPAQIARAEAEESQRAFDAATARMGSALRDEIVYGSVMDAARAEAAVREMDAAHDWARSLEHRLARWSWDVEDSRKKLAKFATDITTPQGQPIHAARWADAMFTSAAQVHVYTSAIMLAKGRGIASLYAIAMNEVLRGAASTSHSSSPSHNIAEAAQLEAWVRVARDISYLLDTPPVFSF